MRTLNIASNLTSVTDGNSTAIDLNTKLIPFAPGNSVVAAFSLDLTADATLTLEGADDAAFTAGVTLYTAVVLDGVGGENKTVYREVTITKQFIRLKSVEGTTGLGTTSCDLLQN